MQSKRRVSVVSVTSAGILDRHTVSGNCKTAKLTIEPTIHTGLRRASVGRYLFKKPSLFYSSSPYATQRNFRSLIYVRKSFTTNEVCEGRKAEFCVQVEGQKKKSSSQQWDRMDEETEGRFVFRCGRWYYT